MRALVEVGAVAVTLVTAWRGQRQGDALSGTSPILPSVGGIRKALALAENLEGSAVGFHLMSQSPDT